MSFWLISVPQNKTAGGQSVLAELQNSTQGLATVNAFDLPQLKVGTLDQLMALRSEQGGAKQRGR